MADYQFPYALTPDQKARLDAAIAANTSAPPTAPVAPPAAAPQNGVLTDIGHGLAASTMVELPKMAGQAMQAFGIAPDTGKEWEQAAEKRGESPDYQTSGAWGAGARGVAPALATLGIGALAAPLGTAAVAAGGAAAAGALFGGSTFQDVKERALASGATPEVAHDAAMKAGLIMGVGQAAAAHIGGQVLAGGAGALASKFIKTGGLANALESFTNPSALKAFGTGFAEMMGVQLPVQAGTAAAMNEVETGAGIKTGQSNFEAAKNSLLPTAAMTTLLAPVGALGARQTVQHRELIAKTVSGERFTPEELADPAVSADRLQAVAEMGRQMRRVAPRDKVAEWQLEAERAILDGAEVDLRNPEFNYDQAKKEAAQAQATAEAQAQQHAADVGPGQEIEAAPAPQDVEHIDAAPPPDAQGETIAMGTEEGARHERMVANRATIRERIEQNQGVHEGGIDVSEASTERIPATAYREAARGLGNETIEAAPAPTLYKAGAPKEERIRALRTELPGARGDLLAKLAVEPEKLAETIRAEWDARGGVNDKTQVSAKLGDLYERVTGEKITGAKDEKSSATPEAAAEVRQGAEPQRAADTAKPEDAASAEQVPQAQGDAHAGTEAGSVPQAGGSAEGQAAEGNITSIGVTRDAIDLLDSVRDGGVPAFMTNNLRRIAKENGIDVGSSDTPNSVVEKIRAKAVAGRAARDKAEAQSTVAKATADITPNLTPREQANLPTFKQNEERRKAAGQAPDGVERRAPPAPTEPPTAKEVAASLPAPELDAQFTKPVSTETAIKKVSATRAKIDALMEERKGLVGVDTKEAQAKLTKLDRKIVDLKVKEEAQQPDKVRTEYDAKQAARLLAHDDAVKTAVEMGVKDAPEHAKRENDDLKKYRDVQGTLDEMLADGRLTPEQHTERTQRLAALAEDRASTPGHGFDGFSDRALHAAVDGKTAGEAMDHIARTHNNPVMRAVAKLLAKWNSNARVRVIENPEFNGGRYDPRTNTIEIGRGGLNPVTLMHETVHALSHAALDRAMANVGRGIKSVSKQGQREIAALRTVQDLMTKFEKVADMRDPTHVLALQDEHEFLSEALSNPSIEEALGGRSGALRRLYNALREKLGLGAGQQTDFDRLMRSGRDLFGAPDNTIGRIFNSALDRAATPGSPRAAMQSMEAAGHMISRVFTARDTDAAAKLRTAGLYMTTLNHGTHMVDRIVGKFKAQFGPESHAVLDRFAAAFRKPGDVIRARGAEAQHLNNAPLEANWHMAEMTKVQNSDKGNFNRMTNMSYRARQAMYDPLKNEPATTPIARDVRAAWNSIKDTASGRLYAQLRQYNELNLLRHFAQQMNQTRVAFGMGRDENLHWFTHTTDRDGRAERNMQAQIGKLDSAIARTLAEAQGHSDEEYKATAVALQNEMQRQRAQPYVHLGRSGDYMIHFDVRPEFYDRVRSIVTGNLKDKTGLDRDMGPDTGMRTVDMRFESEMQHKFAHKMLESLREQGAFKIDTEEGVRDTYAAGKIVDRMRKTDGATPVFIDKLTARINAMDGVDQDTKTGMIREINDAYLSMLPDSNPMKAQMFADQTHGASADFVQSWAKRQEMANHGLVGGDSAMRMGDALKEINAAMKDIRESPMREAATHLADYEGEIKGRVNDMQTAVNSPTIDWARAFTAPFRLALSPAYLVMTAFQPAQMTFPHLGADHGYRNAAYAMARAYGKSYGAISYMFKNAWDMNAGTGKWQRMLAAASPSIELTGVKNKDGTPTFNGAELDLVKAAQHTGLFNFGQTQQIGRPQTVHGDELGKATGALGKFAQKTKEANTIASIFPHFVEMSNRMVTAFAAHELFLTKGKKFANEEARQAFMDATTPEQRKQAQEYAFGKIRDTDGDHSQGNIARGLGRRGLAGKATPALVGFGQYDFQMLESMSRSFLNAIDGPERKVAAKQLAGVFAMTSVMAGTLGLPLVGLFSGLYNRIASAFQEDGDTPPDIEKGWQDAMKGIFGDKAGELISRGLPRALDIDMSSRSGYQDLAPFTSFIQSRKSLGDTINEQGLQFLGPAVGVATGMAMGARDAYEGNFLKASNEALPAFLRNTYKAYRLSEYGYERQSGANELIPGNVSTWNVIAQAAGFNSATKADIGEREQQWGVNQDVMKSRMEIIRNKWLRGMDHDDPKAVGDAMQEIFRFSMMQPQMAHAPAGLSDALRQRMMDMVLSTQTGGVHVGKKQLPYNLGFQGAGQS